MRAELHQLKQNPKQNLKGGKAGKTKTKGAGNSNKDSKFAWKMVPPKAGESHSKTFNGKKYIYCPHHDTTCWVLEVNKEGIEHRTGCRKMVEANSTSSTASNTSNESRGSMALANVMEEENADNGVDHEENL
jgi:hypothetical protein